MSSPCDINFLWRRYSRLQLAGTGHLECRQPAKLGIFYVLLLHQRAYPAPLWGLLHPKSGCQCALWLYLIFRRWDSECTTDSDHLMKKNEMHCFARAVDQVMATKRPSYNRILVAVSKVPISLTADWGINTAGARSTSEQTPKFSVRTYNFMFSFAKLLKGFALLLPVQRRGAKGRISRVTNEAT